MISLVIAVYKVEKYLRKCVDSVLGQTYQNLEIILVDDGSPDGCGAICDEYAQRDSRVKVIHQENGGLSAARNSGLEIARGEYVGFIDSDDYLSPLMYEKLIHTAEEQSADIVICGFNKVDEDGNSIWCTPQVSWSGTGAEFVKTDGVQLNYVWHKLYRRSLFKNIRFPEGKLYEDIFIMHDIFWQAEKVVRITDIGYHYFIRTGSISSNHATEGRLDFCEAVLVRLQFLLDHGASPDAVHFWMMQYCLIWDTYIRAGALKNDVIRKRLKHLHTSFRKLARRAITMKFSPDKRGLYGLLYLNPKLYGLLLPWVEWSKQRAALLWLWNTYLNRKETGLPAKELKAEYRKYAAYLKNDPSRDLMKAQIRAFFRDKITCVQDNLTLDPDPCVPTVVVVEKNERARMELFFAHYRRLGIRQFIVLDNGSTDDTLEYLTVQEGVRVYQTTENFQTQRKEAWLERILAMTGFGRWYIVVDSDELLDYVGSERMSAETMIRIMEHRGYGRLWGIMLDMYARESLFSVECSAMEIPERFCYFDRDSYFLSRKKMNRSTMTMDEIFGGARCRMFGLVAPQSKQAVFRFDRDKLYRNCHYLYPLVQWGEIPCCFVLRHYKFLPQDKKEYAARIQNNSFYNNSIEYKNIMNQVERSQDCSMYADCSVRYENSDSLRCLPYLEEII